MSEPDSSPSRPGPDEPSSSSSTHWVVWTLVSLLLPVLYLLSVTPLAALSVKQRWSPTLDAPPYWLRRYAIPAEWLYENTPLREPLGLYRDWCLRTMLDYPPP